MSRFIFLLIIFCWTSKFELEAQTKTRLEVIKFNPNLDAPLSIEESRMIKEVYGAYYEEKVLNNPMRLRALKDILRNRAEVKKVLHPERLKYTSKLSNVPLFTAYVSNLKKTRKFNPDSFNPLKYQLHFFGKNGAAYSTNKKGFVVFVKPQNYYK
jgi:hypothetical protein